MASSYSDLHQYRQCPRVYGFQKLGYKPIMQPEPLTTGQLVHAGLAAHFRGTDMEEAIGTESFKLTVPKDHQFSHVAILDMQGIIEHSVRRSIELSTRYITHWVSDYQSPVPETVLEIEGVICHPDLTAIYKNSRVIVDYKTSYHPDTRWYDISGQLDLYAYIRWLITEEDTGYVIYDIISEEGIYRHMRKPRVDAGERLFWEIKELEELQDTEDEDKTLCIIAGFLNYPHPAYTCPSRCKFFIPCHLLDTDSWATSFDYLEANYLKRGEA